MNPITPIMTKPIPTACEILINSLLSAIVIGRLAHILGDYYGIARGIRLVHRLMKRVPSFRNSRGMSAI